MKIALALALVSGMTFAQTNINSAKDELGAISDITQIDINEQSMAIYRAAAGIDPIDSSINFTKKSASSQFSFEDDSMEYIEATIKREQNRVEIHEVKSKKAPLLGSALSLPTKEEVAQQMREAQPNYNSINPDNHIVTVKGDYLRIENVNGPAGQNNAVMQTNISSLDAGQKEEMKRQVSNILMSGSVARKGIRIEGHDMSIIESAILYNDLAAISELSHGGAYFLANRNDMKDAELVEKVKRENGDSSSVMALLKVHGNQKLAIDMLSSERVDLLNENVELSDKNDELEEKNEKLEKEVERLAKIKIMYENEIEALIYDIKARDYQIKNLREQLATKESVIGHLKKGIDTANTVITSQTKRAVICEDAVAEMEDSWIAPNDLTNKDRVKILKLKNRNIKKEARNTASQK